MVKPKQRHVLKGESSKDKNGKSSKKSNVSIEDEWETYVEETTEEFDMEAEGDNEDVDNARLDCEDVVEVDESASRCPKSHKVKPVVMKKSKSWAKIWQHFLEYYDNQGLKKAKCKYCGKLLAADSNNNGTSSLHNHRKICKKNPENIGCVNTLDAFCASSGSTREFGTTKWKFNQLDTRKALARMIVVDELPFIFVEHEGFKYFMSVACPQFIIPSRTTVTKDVLDLYSEQKKLMIANFKKSKQRVSLTTDTWTSNQHITYMVLTAHYIDENWKLQKMILNFTPISSHKGEDMGRLIEKCLHEWGIDDVFTITVDNAASNDTTVSYIRKRLVNRNKALLGGKYLHMRCIAHIANLVVKNGLKHLSIPVDRIRTVVVYMRNSSIRWQRFKDYAEEENVGTKKLLSLDCPTRWNSVLKMLESAVIFRGVFEKFALLDAEFKKDYEKNNDQKTKRHYSNIGEPTKDDWDIAEKLVVVLRHFYDLTLRVSASKYVTSNVFLDDICDIVGVLKKWVTSSDFQLSEIASRMQSKFNKYWGSPVKMNMLLYVVVMLDPRYKMDYVIYSIKEMYAEEMGNAIADLAKTSLHEMFDEYKRLHGPSPSQTTSGSSSPSAIDESSKFRNARLEMFLAQSGEQEFSSVSELDSYLNEKRIKFVKDFDLVKWWKNKIDLYPILARLARDLLAMPISSVASEAAFSTGGRIIDDFRSSLAPTTVQALICTQDWLRGAPTPSVEEDYEASKKLEEDWLATVSKEFAAISI